MILGTIEWSCGIRGSLGFWAIGYFMRISRRRGDWRINYKQSFEIRAANK